jgi:hypothetical protein
MFVRDGSAPRVFLGPLALFQNQPAMHLLSPYQLPASPQYPQSRSHLLGMAQIPQPIAAPLGLQAITPPAQAHGPAAGVAIPQARSASQQAGGKKIPRPSNAWIMYRKHFHAAFAQANHGISNVQLCKSSNLHFSYQANRL